MQKETDRNEKKIKKGPPAKAKFKEKVKETVSKETEEVEKIKEIEEIESDKKNKKSLISLFNSIDQKKLSTALLFCIMISLSCCVVMGGLFLYRKGGIKNTYYSTYGESFSKNEYSVFYMLYVTDFLNKYGAYLDDIGLDINKDFNAQQFDENKTWQDYFAEQTNKELSQFVVLNKDIKKTKTKVDTKSQVNDLIKIFENNAKIAGVDKETYLQGVFGKGVTEKDVRMAVEYKYNAIEYSNILYQKLKDEIDEKELVSLYTEYPESFDKVLYRKFTVPNDVEFTYEGKTEDDFIEIAKNLYPNMDTLYASVGMDNESNDEIVTWLYDKTRKYGDTELFETEDGLTYVFFKKKDICDDRTVDLRIIYFNTYMADSEEKAEIKKNADAVYSSLLEENSEDAFASYALVYSDDTLSKDSGGLMSCVSEGNVPEEIAGWVFDKERKQGDLTLLENDEGYYILCFVKENEIYWKAMARTYLADKAYNDYVENLKTEYGID